MCQTLPEELEMCRNERDRAPPLMEPEVPTPPAHDSHLESVTKTPMPGPHPRPVPLETSSTFENHLTSEWIDR